MLVNMAKQGLGLKFGKNTKRFCSKLVRRQFSFKQEEYAYTKSEEKVEMYKPQYKLYFSADDTVLLYKGPKPLLFWKNWLMIAVLNFFLYKVYTKIRERAWLRTMLYGGGMAVTGIFAFYQFRFRRLYISSIKLRKDGQTALFNKGFLGKEETLVTLKSIYEDESEATQLIEEGGLRRVLSNNFNGVLDLGIDSDSEDDGTPDLDEGIYIYDMPLLLEVINGREIEIEKEQDSKFIDIR